MKTHHGQTHKDLVVWQTAMHLAEQIYLITRSFPTTERYGMAAQMRRAAVSIPSNIAEGAARRTSAEFRQFLHIARGSWAELETQTMLATRMGMVDVNSGVERDLERVGRLLNGLIVAIAKHRSLASDESRITSHESPE